MILWMKIEKKEITSVVKRIAVLTNKIVGEL